jgi:hypothetical protein
MDPIVKAGQEKLLAADIIAWLEAHRGATIAVGSRIFGHRDGHVALVGRRNIVENDGQKTGPTDAPNDIEQAFG